MEQPTGHHLLFKEIDAELVKHGYGELAFKYTSMKDNRVKIEIYSGKSYVCFIKKKIEFSKDDIL